LGHTISKEGISVDPSKVQEVMDWKPPMSVHQIRSCWGYLPPDSKFVSVMRAQMVSAWGNGVYTSSGLRGVIPYV
jgi:hypothetical protein